MGAVAVASHELADVDQRTHVTRTFTPDRFGRRLTSDDPDTDDPGGTTNSRTWRYLYNKANDLVAVRDPRGCGHYVYRWDELNRIAEARRYDGSGGGSWTLMTRERYRYDGANQRVIKQSITPSGSCSAPPASNPCERIALYVYPVDFERRGLYRDATGMSYEPHGGITETQYVIAGARTVFRSGGDPEAAGFQRDARLIVPVSDLIQTSSAAFDVRTGELVEASTYYPNGGRRRSSTTTRRWCHRRLRGSPGRKPTTRSGSRTSGSGG
ncbi:MAG: hypothetical protein AB7S26_12235 [Sandaracinaceae bacterium]